MIELQLQARPADEQDRTTISNLIFYENHAHRHLDWRPPLDWLGSPYFWLIEDRGRALAALACPPDPPGIAWVRLFACDGNLPTREAWHILWEEARREIARRGGAPVGIIAMQAWFRDLLAESEFENRQNIVMLEWKSAPFLPPSLPRGVRLRPMREADLPAAAEVDAQAFDPFWVYSLDSLQRAFSQALVATVAETDAGLGGYQLSTGNPTRAHLARLAVRREAQGRGIGTALTADLLLQMRRRGALHISVNTQNDNAASLKMYQKLGFARTGETYPVYRYNVPAI